MGTALWKNGRSDRDTVWTGGSSGYKGTTSIRVQIIHEQVQILGKNGAAKCVTYTEITANGN